MTTLSTLSALLAAATAVSKGVLLPVKPGDFDGRDSPYGCADTFVREYGEMIAASVNALPSLLALARAAEAYRDATYATEDIPTHNGHAKEGYEDELAAAATAESNTYRILMASVNALTKEPA